MRRSLGRAILKRSSYEYPVRKLVHFCNFMVGDYFFKRIRRLNFEIFNGSISTLKYSDFRSKVGMMFLPLDAGGQIVFD